MSFCPKCGATLKEGATFCTGCGAQVNSTAQPVANPVQPTPIPAQPGSNTAGRLHCPNCKSHNISISTESSVTGAVTTHHGGFSSTHVSNNHRNYWFCADCGTKFRNVQNLEEEINKSKSTPTVMFVLAVISAAIFLYLFTNIKDNPLAGLFFGVFTVGAAVAAVVFLILGFYYKGQLKKMRDELAHLKVNCFN